MIFQMGGTAPHFSHQNMPKNSKRKGQPRPMKRGKEFSGLVARSSTSVQWTLSNQPFPAFHNTLKKDNGIHRFIQFVDKGVFQNLSNSIPNFGAIAFNWNDLGQVSSFQNIFDQYRIDEVEVWLFSPQTTSTSPASNNAMFYSVVDYDDANVPSSFAALQQYTNVNVSTLNDGHYLRFVPHLGITAGAGAGVGNVRRLWLDSANSNVPHFGVKYGVPALPASGLTMNYWVRYHFSCRNVF